ncbi:MAG: ATPase, partial [Lachnospiraceae bacterium]|nr:ATPase [Lachnospiraceae bacterium]
MYINRKIENVIKEAADSFPSIVIYGSRQVGKSTTADHVFGKAFRSVTLDDGEDRALAKESPRLFLETY